MTPRIIIPHGLAAAVLAVLTRRSDRWTDEDELVDLVRCQYIEALDAFPNEGAHAGDVMDAASNLAGANFIDEDPVYRMSEEDIDLGETFYAWRTLRDEPAEVSGEVGCG